MDRRTRRLTALVLLVALVLVVPGAAFAEPMPGDKAAAQALFDDALKLLAKGEPEEACRKLEESERLDAAMGTRFRLAECYETIGRTASAWAGYIEVADLARAAGQVSRERAARARALSLEPRLARLVIDVATPDLAGLEVRRDGLGVGRAQWGTAIPIDPGSHRVTASAPGKTPWSGEVTIGQDPSGVIASVPALVDERTAASAPVAALAPPSPAPRPEAAAGHGRRVAGFVVMGAGVLGLGASGVLGLVAKSSYDGASAHCQGEVCDPEGKAATDSARRLGQVATVVLAVSAVTVVGGAVLWLTAPRTPATAPAPARAKAELRVRATPQALFMEGVF